MMMMKWQIKKSQQALTMKRILKCPFDPHQPLPPQPVGQLLLVAGIYMPYIEGPHMDWTVNDHLYHRFLKWHLKCKNILECKLVALPGTPAVQEGNCMEWRLQNGPICVLELILK